MKTNSVLAACPLTTALLLSACSDAVDDKITADNAIITGDTASNDDPAGNPGQAMGPCPSIAKFGIAYRNPCQLELTFKLEIVKTESLEEGGQQLQGESKLATSGGLNQLYPPPILGENLAFLEFSGEINYAGWTSGRPAYYPEPRPTGWRESTFESQAEFAGPVTLLLIDGLEPHPDDPSRLCLTVGMEATMTGSRTTISTLPDGTTREEEKGPMSRWFRNFEDGDEWKMKRATNATSSLPPSQTIVCEGSPPTGDQGTQLADCSESDCQVEYFGSPGAMTWYGLTANAERNHWTFSGEVSDSEIIGGYDTEYEWNLDIDLAIVPQTLEYD